MQSDDENKAGQLAYSRALERGAAEGYEGPFLRAYADALMTQGGWSWSSFYGWSRD